MELIDTHAHLDLEKHFPHFEAALATTHAAGVKKIILPGVTQAGWARLMRLHNATQGIFAAPGLHPLYLEHHQPHYLQELAEIVDGNTFDRPVAIGEIGLDYYPEKVDRNAQQQLFEQQLKIAATAELPILLHVRKAHDQVLKTLRQKHFSEGGIVHAFSGSYQQACAYIKLGFAIGICGTITYDRALRIRKVAAQLPQAWLVLETDAPDIPLATHRGENNHPRFLPEILEILAALRGESKELTADYTCANSKRVLHLPN